MFSFNWVLFPSTDSVLPFLAMRSCRRQEGLVALILWTLTPPTRACLGLSRYSSRLYKYSALGFVKRQTIELVHLRCSLSPRVPSHVRLYVRSVFLKTDHRRVAVPPSLRATSRPLKSFAARARPSERERPLLRLRQRPYYASRSLESLWRTRRRLSSMTNPELAAMSSQT